VQPSRRAHSISENLTIIVFHAPTCSPMRPGNGASHVPSAAKHCGYSIGTEQRVLFLTREEEMSLFGQSTLCQTFRPDVSTVAERIKVGLCLRGVEEANVWAI